ncbi:hypothetical protein XENORESO_008562 [Xenotaenia resolanae]|uniref:Uncharacterized protein n=1 Tax=Xenotaenia resolanae TaxID=208358 RepID=A0ABV0WLH1_9TELE
MAAAAQPMPPLLAREKTEREHKVKRRNINLHCEFPYSSAFICCIYLPLLAVLQKPGMDVADSYVTFVRHCQDMLREKVNEEIYIERLFDGHWGAGAYIQRSTGERP